MIQFLLLLFNRKTCTLCMRLDIGWFFLLCSYSPFTCCAFEKVHTVWHWFQVLFSLFSLLVYPFIETNWRMLFVRVLNLTQHLFLCLAAIFFSFSFLFFFLANTISIYTIDKFYAVGWLSLLFLAFFLITAMTYAVYFFSFLLFPVIFVSCRIKTTFICLFETYALYMTRFFLVVSVQKWTTGRPITRLTICR